MSGTDPENKRPTRELSPASQERAEWSRLRALMMTDRAWLVTVAGRRWLADSYTLLNVTDSRALWTDERHETEIPDAHYQLTAGKGLVPIDPEDVAPDIAGLLAVVERDESGWLPVYETPWTIAGEAKAMLVFAQHEDHRDPLMINEEVWTGYFAQYDENKRETRTVRFEKNPARPGQPFRVLVIETFTDVTGEEIELAEVLAYVMGVAIPDGERWGKQDAREAAQYIVDEATA